MTDKIVVSKLFLDSDGCFCDFDKKVKEIFNGKSPEEITDRVMWPVLAKYMDPITGRDFFDSLEWIPGSKELWNILKGYENDILTGMPRGGWAKKGKEAWWAREAGVFHIITCMSKDKQLHSGAGRLLIDDRKKNCDQWVAMGGEAILFTSPEQAIAELDRFDLSDLAVGY